MDYRRAGLSGLIFVVALCAGFWPGRAVSLTGSDRQIYAEAFELAAAKRYEQARTRAAAGGEALLGKFFDWLELSRGRGEGDFAALSAFLDGNPDWPQLRLLQRRAEDSLPDSLSDEAVRAWFANREPLTAAGALRLAAALSADGQAVPQSMLRRIWVEARFTKAQETAFRARYGALLREGDEIARLERLLKVRAARAAKRQAKRLDEGRQKLAAARLALMFDRAGVDAAIARVPAALQDDPGLLYERARWRQRRDRLEGVIELVERAAPHVRRAERWWGLRRWAVRRSLAAGRPAESYRLASAHGLKEGVGFAEGEWLAGWVALRFQDAPATAYRHFKRLYGGVTLPISRARGAYWTALAAAAAGRTEEARRWYERAARHDTTFYGQQARAALGQPVDFVLESRHLVPQDVRRRFEARELVRLSRLLAGFGQGEHLGRLLRHLRLAAAGPEDYVLLAELSTEVGRHDQALFTAKQARRLGTQLPDHLFPLPAELTAALGAEGGPEPALVMAVIRQESAFNPRAISRAGARGLMQLMPATAKKVARRIKLPYRRAALIEDPAYNLRLGQAYLARQLTDFNGASILALAAYNAGPQRVQRWLRAYGDPRKPGVDPIDWIERIPFEETRNYVQRVLEGQVVYRLALTGQRTVLPLHPAASKLGAVP